MVRMAESEKKAAAKRPRRKPGKDEKDLLVVALGASAGGEGTSLRVRIPIELAVEENDVG